MIAKPFLLALALVFSCLPFTTSVHGQGSPATGVLAALETVLEFEPVPESGREILVEARGGLIRFSQLLVQRDPLEPMPAAPVETLLRGQLERSCRAASERLDPLGRMSFAHGQNGDLLTGPPRRSAGQINPRTNVLKIFF